MGKNWYVSKDNKVIYYVDLVQFKPNEPNLVTIKKICSLFEGD